MIEIEATFS